MSVYFEASKFGVRAIVKDAPTAAELPEFANRKVNEVVCNRSLGWTGRDISFLRDIPRLTSVTIFDTTGLSLEPLTHLLQLKRIALHIHPSQQFDFSKLQSLEDCSFAWFAGAESATSLRNLKKLSIDQLPWKYAGSLERLDGLNELKILNSDIRSLSFCRALTHLTYLRVTNCAALTSLEGLTHVRQLEDLLLQRCPFRHTKAIAELSALRSLTLDDCGDVDSIQCFSNLHCLERLVISGSTRIVDGDLSVLVELPMLKVFAGKNHKHYGPSVRVVQEHIQRKQSMHKDDR